MNSHFPLDSQTGSTVQVVQWFNDAFNRHDVDALMALLTHDCVFENTRPAPDGERLEGQQRVRAFWEQFFSRSLKRTARPRTGSRAARVD
jgi:ketosteroid isomerase-like protein